MIGGSTRRALLVVAASVIACGCSGPVEEDASSRGAVASGEGATSPRGISVRGQAPPAARGFRSVVSFIPTQSPPGPPSEEQPGMDQFGREFYPDVLIVNEAQTVEFANGEQEMHNVHVRSVEDGETTFNVGTPAGGSYRHRFERVGAYHVTCDVHSEMEAFLIVVEPGFSVKADKTGSFEIDNLAAEEYRIVVWSADPGAISERVLTLEHDAAELDLTEPP